MIRIAITGSHSVGKTTLAKKLMKKLSAMDMSSMVAEEPIEVVRRQHPGIVNDPNTFYIRLLEEHFKRLNGIDCDCCLYDRSLMDLLVYYRLEEPDNPAFTSLLEEMLQWYVRSIDLFFYLPIEFPLVADGRRPLSETYREQVDEMLKTVARKAAIRWITIAGSIQERVAKAVAVIRTYDSSLER
ncbi:MAG: ATP-binding protein [Deltaproteobacteria bacterium]|nr:ATP-binding protein [Candidatus Anaeroferrophillus wilburensis]MBN2887904.1 ATP-binding protein [Deltaproteobacteria bacterium]